MSGRATQFLEKMHSVGGPFFIQYVCVYPSSNIVVVVMPVVVLVLSMEPHYHYKDIIKASKIVTEQLLITIINLILYKKKYSKSSTILGHYIW